MCSRSYVSTTALCREVVWHCTVAVSAWCSMHQLPGCECTMNRSRTPLRHQNGAYMGIYGHMQPYIQVFAYIYKLKTCIYASYCTFICVYLCFIAYIYADVCVYRCILACIWSHPLLITQHYSLGRNSRSKENWQRLKTDLKSYFRPFDYILNAF